MKLRRIIIISNVLVCFLLNNLFFTYASEIRERMVIECASEDGSCCKQTEATDFCPPCRQAGCEKENCCAQVPVQTAHLNFSVIIGVEKKQDPTLTSPELTNFYLSHLNLAAELAEGHLNSLIKPPATA